MDLVPFGRYTSSGVYGHIMSDGVSDPGVWQYQEFKHSAKVYIQLQITAIT